MEVSIVIPIKDEKENIRRLHERITASLRSLSASYEIVLVDDGSTDGGHLELEALAAFDARVKVVRLRRNFGQSAAMQAGIDHAAGDVIFTMDGDLQNDGFLTVANDKIELTRAGLLQVDRLLPAFFEAEHRGTRYT